MGMAARSLPMDGRAAALGRWAEAKFTGKVAWGGRDPGHLVTSLLASARRSERPSFENSMVKP